MAATIRSNNMALKGVYARYKPPPVRIKMAALVLTPAFHSQATENALAAIAMRCNTLSWMPWDENREGLGTNVTLRCIVRGARAAYHAFLKVTQRTFPPRGRRGWFLPCQSSDVMPYCH